MTFQYKGAFPLRLFTGTQVYVWAAFPVGSSLGAEPALALGRAPCMVCSTLWSHSTALLTRHLCRWRSAQEPPSHRDSPGRRTCCPLLPVEPAGGTVHLASPLSDLNGRQREADHVAFTSGDTRELFKLENRWTRQRCSLG